MATIKLDLTDGILTITMDRPERLNAFTATTRHELIAAFDRADADDEVRVVVVTGAGRGFCAGHDLAEGKQTFATDGLQPDGGGLLALRIFRCHKPVIAAINGAAVGIGATMTLPMDVRLASTEAKFGFVFTRRGIVPEAASSWFLPRVVGISRAMEWTATGRVFSAAEAERAGLVRDVFAPDELLPAAYALGREIADHAAPVSVALSRQMLWRMLGEPHPMAAHRVESRALAARGDSADAHEGIASFLAKRPAVFTDRVGDGVPDVFPDWREPEWS